MKIIISSLVFYPDHSGIALYSTDFARFCAEQGHDVDVITGFSFYPHWQKKIEDKGKLFRMDEMDGVRIHRGYIYVPQKITPLKRIVSELSFLSSAVVNFFKVGKADAIVVFTTPVLLGWLTIWFKWLYKSKLIINVQDFQIEAAESLGLLNESIILKFIKYLENNSYNNADHVTSISNSMVDVLKKKGINNYLLWPNWIDVKEEGRLPSPRTFRGKFNLDDEFIIAYAGNIGEKQGLEFYRYIQSVQSQHKFDIFNHRRGCG